jgi:hypothetical protein
MIRLKNRIAHKLLRIIIIIICISSIANGASYSFEFASDSAVLYIQLPHQNIFSGSVNILSEGKKIYIIDRIDYSQGIVFLNDNIHIDKPLLILYEYLSYKLPEYIFTRKLQPDDQTKPIVKDVNDIIIPKREGQTDAKSFILSGSKSISVSAGSTQDLDLNQRLNLRVRGEPVKGLQVVGSLSDKAQPQAGGLSSAFEDIESISLTATGHNFQVKLGDINYRHQWGGIGSFSKKMKGVDTDFRYREFYARATISSLKGKYKTASLFAINGVSGPYSLKNETGSRTSIVGGTEKVYLDGQILKVGASEDYLIDYALGEIIFNPRISLTSRSRIVVDYEYLDQSYRRNFYSGEMGYSLFSKKLKLSVGYLGLSDSRDNPVDFIFSPDDMDVLRSAGDNQNDAARDGAVFVGAANGNYKIEIDTAGNTYYIFVGDSLGDYNVKFSRVASNAGDYSYLGGGKYLFKGKNRGNYLPFEYLALPAVTHGIYVGSELELGGFLDLSMKLSGSDNDLNSFSDFDDSDNNGFLGELKLAFHPVDSSVKQKTINNAETTIQIKIQDRDFLLPGRSEVPELNRKWALGTDTINDQAKQFEVKQALKMFDLLDVKAELGHLDDGDDVYADRNLFDFSVEPTNYLDLNFNRIDRISGSEIDSISNRIYQNRTAAIFHNRGFRLTGGWEDESDNRLLSFVQSPGTRFDRYFSDINYSGVRLSVSRRKQSRLVDLWQDEYQDWVLTSGLTRSFFKGSLKVEAEVTRREIEYAGDSLPDFSETRSLSRFSFGGSSNFLNGYVSYRLNRQLITRLARNFIKVEEGQGNYRLEDSVYVRDEFGDYIAIDELIEAGDAGISSEKSINLKVDLLKILPGLKKINQLYTESNLNLEEQGTGNYRLNLLYALPFWEVYPGDELFFKQDFRQIINLGTRRGHKVSIGFEENHTRDKIRDLSSERYRRLIYERVYFALSKTFNLKLEHRFKREKEASGYFGTADFSEHDLSIELLFYSGKNFELNIKPRYLTGRGQSDDLRITLVGALVSPAISFTGKGRITGEFSYFNVSEKQDRFIPYQFALGNRPGENLKWGVGFNYKYNKFITTRLKYSADKIPGLSARHKVSLTMKAIF